MEDREPKPTRRWRRKFQEAFHGLKLGVRGQSSFFGHFFFTALTIALAVTLDCTLIEWCLLIGCIGLVLTAEMINSSIETLFKGLEESGQQRIQGCLDIAAGAVLIASGTALLIGGIIFLNRLYWLIESITSQ